MPQSPLFRSVAQGDPSGREGSVLGATQRWIVVYTAFLVAVFVAGAMLVFAGEYARRSRVTGFLVPDLGLIKVFAPKDGRVTTRLVAEGRHVSRDEPLLVIDVGSTTTLGRTGDRIAEALTQRRALLAGELQRLDVVQQAEHNKLVEAIAALEAQVVAMGEELDQRRIYLRFAENAVGRNRALQTQSVYSLAQVERVEMDTAQAQIQIASLTKALAATRGDLAQGRAQLAGLADKHANEHSQLERLLREIDQQLAQTEEQRLIYVRAPQDGIVTGITLDAGGFASVATPLLTIVPDGARLQANLYVASAAAGFVKPGTQLLIRYDAYPYEKFGLQDAEVLSVSRTAVNPKELPFPVSGDDPLYLVTARLAKQTITAFGTEESLQPGAKLQAALILERRKLWEWAIEPLLAARASL